LSFTSTSNKYFSSISDIVKLGNFHPVYENDEYNIPPAPLNEDVFNNSLYSSLEGINSAWILYLRLPNDEISKFSSLASISFCLFVFRVTPLKLLIANSNNGDK